MINEPVRRDTPAPVSAERERLIFEGLGTLPDELISQLSAARLAPYVIHLRDMLRADAALLEHIYGRISRRDKIEPFDETFNAIAQHMQKRTEYDRRRADAGTTPSAELLDRMAAAIRPLLVWRDADRREVHAALAEYDRLRAAAGNDRASAGEGGGGDDYEYRHRSLPGPDGETVWLPWQRFTSSMQIRRRTQPTPEADGVAAVAYANQKSLDRMQKAREKGHPGFLADISNLPIVMDGMTVPLYTSPRAAVNPVVSEAMAAGGGICHCTCHNDPLYCRKCNECNCHKKDTNLLCNICKRFLNNSSDPLSQDCGGDCWGCIGAIEAEGGDEESKAKYNEEVRKGIRKGPLIP